MDITVITDALIELVQSLNLDPSITDFLSQYIDSLQVLPLMPIMFLMGACVYVVMIVCLAFGVSFDQIEVISEPIIGFFMTVMMFVGKIFGIDV